MTITNATQTQFDAKLTSSQPAPAKSQSGASTKADSVQISGSAKAALQEATETADQTAKEARGGDRQAQHLLATEAAAAKATER